MSAARWLIAIACLAGCNQVFGLEPTQSTTELGDVDKDGVADAEDNCPTIFNDTQANDDGDPFGDACDACPAFKSTTTHDEDGDAVGDECDVCPSIEDLHADKDGDGVGDECDQNPDSTASPDHRIAFEPFVTMPGGWQTGAGAWAVAEDSIAPNADLAMSDPGLTATITTGTGRWYSAAMFIARTRWQPPDRFGLVARGPSQTLSCVVTCSGNSACVGAQRLDSNPSYSAALLPRPSMLVAIVVSSAGAASCYFEGVYQGVSHNSTLATNGMTISIIASPHVRAAFFEHVQ
jgi:hypothetical protein